MRFTLPEPPHGWRDFTWEVAIVFIGVVLALGGGRLIQQYDWKGDASQASVAIKAELAEHQLDAVERLAVQRCLRNHLKAIFDKLSAHQGGHWAGMPMTLNDVGVNVAAQHVSAQAYRAPERLWLDDAWQTARASGALNHLPAATVAKYSDAYNRGNRMRQLQTEEKLAAAGLAALAVSGPIDVRDRTELLGALAQVDHANSSMERSARYLLAYLSPLLTDLPREEVDKAVAKRMAIQRGFRGSCVQSLRLKRT